MRSNYLIKLFDAFGMFVAYLDILRLIWHVFEPDLAYFEPVLACFGALFSLFRAYPSSLPFVLFSCDVRYIYVIFIMHLPVVQLANRAGRISVLSFRSSSKTLIFTSLFSSYFSDVLHSGIWLEAASLIDPSLRCMVPGLVDL